MKPDDKKKPLSIIAFTVILTLVVFAAILYTYNIIIWSNFPDFGFGFRTATGINVVGVVTHPGREAGMQVGDFIKTVNNKSFKNIAEFRAAMQRELGETNNYLLDRTGRTFNVTITNKAQGFKKSFAKSGFPLLLGLCYILIGVIVFLMKPHQRSSWIFFIFTSTFGLFLTFLYKSGVMKPLLLEDLNIFAFTFTPAAFIHLALCFPEERLLLRRHPSVQIFPYIFSTLLFLMIRSVTGNIMDVPKIRLVFMVSYMAAGVLWFIGSCLQLRLTSTSEIVKTRSRMILLGFAISASLPLIDLVTNTLFHMYIVPGFNYYLPFFIMFPLFVGYSIVKHNLFDFDAIIKRTYGYVLTTASIAGVYGLFVLISNVAFGRFEVTTSPIFPLVFTMVVVFFFNPIRNRVQKFIDRVFYRLEYDYRDTVKKISERMRSLLTLDEIGKSIIETALETMFIDAGCVMLLNKKAAVYECLISEGEREIRHCQIGLKNTLPADGPFFQKIAERKKEVTVYDIQEDPFFEDEREHCQAVFDQLEATIVIPLIYEDRLRGLISLGQKKSGKFYRRTDINLLNILANQGAMAIENALMIEEMIEKERVKANILKTFGKYVTREVRDQILDGHIPLDGEVKDVTILFADLRDFTILAESNSPKKVVKIINSYFSEMADAISKHKGLVLQFIGDEIEAVFGAPLALNDHPTHAVRAAIAMRERMLMVNKNLQQQGYVPLRHGIGIHTGGVVAANIGSEDRLSYALVGDTVNVASRIQGLNKKFGTDILISATTVARLTDNLDIEKLPATTVKGKRDPVGIFKLI
jgi:class 3 adenylate cyclase